ncbi:hypothetical protein CK203_111930 [Vitis vinifera]|uniref:Reverse transcriptase domain-containing protein n=1 Tax=Vitis vinifera TaxID=29760 RepID=A0A438BMW0_VITVI|nr:hypothetical protein CK203_111930 [Vitis vinifera]
MMHQDVEVYVDDMIVKSWDRTDHLVALERFFKRIRQFRLRLNPKKCTFGVTSRKLLGCMVSERGIEANSKKIKAILEMPTSRTEKEMGGFLGKLQCISRFIARLTNISLLLGIGMGYHEIETLHDIVFKHLISRLDNLRYLFDRPALPSILMRWIVLMIEFDIHYVTQKSIKGSVVADHLASLLVSDSEVIDDDFLDEGIVIVTRLPGWRMYFNGAANPSE